MSAISRALASSGRRIYHPPSSKHEYYLGGKRTDLRVEVRSVDGSEAIQLTMGSHPDWIASPAVARILSLALQTMTLTAALRQLFESHQGEGWGRVELFELLRYHLCVDHSVASLVLYWEPESSKGPEQISDDRLNADLTEPVRSALARMNAGDDDAAP